MLVIALVAMTSCSSDDEPSAASQEQMERVTGHWYAELPMSGETANWRTEEEGDMTSYNKIVALFYLNGYVPGNSYWGYLYLQDDDMVNYGGIDLNEKSNMFDFAMDSNGLITPTSHLANAPKMTNMRYDSQNDVITADVTYNGQTMTMTFKRPTEEQETQLEAYYDILLEEGIVGGYEDRGNHLKTDVKDENADKPSRARIFTTTDYMDSVGALYDLSGRKLDKKQTAKGVYINGGRKVVMK